MPNPLRTIADEVCEIILAATTRVTQKTLHVWEEDEVGWPIWPLPIEWAAWRAARLQQTNNKRRVPGTKAA
jgi:hypothetical protein